MFVPLLVPDTLDYRSASTIKKYTNLPYHYSWFGQKLLEWTGPPIPGTNLTLDAVAPTCTTPPTPKMLYTRNILKVDFSTNDVLSNTRADESNGSYYGTV